MGLSLKTSLDEPVPEPRQPGNEPGEAAAEMMPQAVGKWNMLSKQQEKAEETGRDMAWRQQYAGGRGTVSLMDNRVRAQRMSVNRRKPGGFWCAVLSVLVLIAAVRCLRAQSATEAGADKERNRVVVAALPFRDSSPEEKYAPLAEAMGDMLVSFLSRAEGLVFVERAALDKVLKEQELSLTGLVEDKTKAEVGRLLAANYMLSGGVTVLEGKLRINAHLFEVETTRVARSEEAEGEVDDLIKPVSTLAQKLGKDLNLELPELDESEIDKWPESNLHFMRGLGYYYGKMSDHAIAEFMKALALKPDHARARYWNGVCYFDDKEYDHAKIEFDRFLDEFPEHELAPKVKEMLGTCATEIQKPMSVEKGE